jgi:glycosyltransferase involved in cell wall biosynthesis
LEVKVGIYAPHISAYGGGEKYICKIAEVLSNENNKVDLIVPEGINKDELKNRLNVNLDKVIVKTIFSDNFIDRLIRRIPLVRDFFRRIRLYRLTSSYELFISQENVINIHSLAISLLPTPSRAKKSIYICQIPPLSSAHSKFLSKLSAFTLIGNFLFDFEMRTYNIIIVYSNYHKSIIEKCWKHPCKVIYPFTDISCPDSRIARFAKKNFIIHVGRFVADDDKKQLVLIRAFVELFKSSDVMKKYKLLMIGSVTNDFKSREYIDKCKLEAKGYPVYFFENIPYDKLLELYSRSKIFWQAMGFGENDSNRPERLWPFSISAVEAMSMGCVPLLVKKGGLVEIVNHGVDGFLWSDLDELKEYTLELVNSDHLVKMMSENAIKRARIFSEEKFIRDIKQLISEVVKIGCVRARLYEDTG